MLCGENEQHKQQQKRKKSRKNNKIFHVLSSLFSGDGKIVNIINQGRCLHLSLEVLSFLCEGKSTITSRKSSVSPKDGYILKKKHR